MQLNLNIDPIESWLVGSDKPVIISGPCSAESEGQLLGTAREISNLNRVAILRAGIWKPRTRPNAFEGVGVEGLKWLKQAKNETGLMISTEVANANHVELCLKYGVDVLWIGARTSVNPFSVQEIANAVKGVDIPVMVKNPINPDLQLWIGALERVNQAGITKLVAIHRGFSSFKKTPFRNLPMWELPIELKTMCPELPIICDPSHIAGTTDLIPMISQKAIDLDMAGLMIECHIQPKVALSDASQQVTPTGLEEVLEDLIIRVPTTQNKEFKTKLDELRRVIDDLDDHIIQDLASRMEIAEKIGEYKRDNNVTILQVTRWDEIVQKRINMGSVMGLGEEFLKQLLQLIHKESIRRQTEVMNREVVK
jgi:chorismate mutase